MRMIYFNIIILTTFVMSLSSNSVWNPAIQSLEPEDITHIRSLALSKNPPTNEREKKRYKELDGISTWMETDDSKKRKIVVVRTDQHIVGDEKDEWEEVEQAGSKIKVTKRSLKTYTDYSSTLESLWENKEVEIIFTGVGLSGAIATYLALKMDTSDTPSDQKGDTLRNRVKVVTFFPDNRADQKFEEVVDEFLGKKNLLHFETYSCHNHYGIPITILPTEYLTDVVFRDYRKMLKALLAGVVLGFIEKNASVISENGRASCAIGALPFVLSHFLVYLKEQKWAVSEKMIKEAFTYTQNNYLADESASLAVIGRPSLFSWRRGVGGMIGRLIGIS